jgi:calcineurin-like phosphoesterase family protein
MLAPSRSRAIALFLCALCHAGNSSAVERDWTRFPAVVEIDTTEDVFAIGDIHGDYVRLASAMNAAGLIDGLPEKPQEVKWRGGAAVLVVTGDMIDKGPRAVDVLKVLSALQIQAARRGGRVIVLLGNHEAEFLAEPRAKKGSEFSTQLAANGFRPADVAACKGEIGTILCSLPVAARVNDWFFSHGGNTAGRSISQIATDSQKGVSESGFGSKQLIADHSILEARLNGTGPGREPWIDAEMPNRDEKSLLKSYTTALGVRHIVQGHVPSRVLFADGTVRESGEMFQRFGLLFLIDTGMSEGVNYSRGAVLHITSTDATAVCPNGKTTLLWDGRHPQDMGRAAPCKE